MAVRTFEELTESVRTIIGDKTDDESLRFIEDFSDTLADAKDRVESSIDWEKKYHELDDEWRNRYRDRFFNGEGGADRSPETEVVETKKTYDDLFEH